MLVIWGAVLNSTFFLVLLLRGSHPTCPCCCFFILGKTTLLPSWCQQLNHFHGLNLHEHTHTHKKKGGRIIFCWFSFVNQLTVWSGGTRAKRKMGVQPGALVWSWTAVLVIQPVSSKVTWNISLALMELLGKLGSIMTQGGRVWLSETKRFNFEKICNTCYRTLKKKYKLLWF